jgi:hypothetical protein
VVLQTVKLGLTKFGNQAKPLKYSEKKVYFITFRADVQMYGHDLDTQPTMWQRLT